jgi:hypothetical protein
VSGLHACPPRFASTRFLKRMVRRVLLGGVFATMAVPCSYAVGGNGEGIKTGETVCACASGENNAADVGAGG